MAGGCPRSWSSDRGVGTVRRFAHAAVAVASTLPCMADPEVLQRIAARRAELDELEEQLAKRLEEVRTERDELAVAERVVNRMSE